MGNNLWQMADLVSFAQQWDEIAHSGLKERYSERRKRAFVLRSKARCESNEQAAQ